MVMTTVYVVETGRYSDRFVLGAYLSVEDAAHSLAHHWPGEVIITAFDKDHIIGGDSNLYVMNYYRELDWRDSSEEAITLRRLPDFHTIDPIVCVRDKPDYVPDITVVGSCESRVRETFNNTLEAEAVKRGWVSEW